MLFQYLIFWLKAKQIIKPNKESKETDHMKTHLLVCTK
jgi:hypothetical protein